MRRGVPFRCPEGHGLQVLVVDSVYVCDTCEEDLPERSLVADCRRCDWTACSMCAPGADPPVAQEAGRLRARMKKLVDLVEGGDAMDTVELGVLSEASEGPFGEYRVLQLQLFEIEESMVDDLACLGGRRQAEDAEQPRDAQLAAGGGEVPGQVRERRQGEDHGGGAGAVGGTVKPPWGVEAGAEQLGRARHEPARREERGQGQADGDRGRGEPDERSCSQTRRLIEALIAKEDRRLRRRFG